MSIPPFSSSPNATSIANAGGALYSYLRTNGYAPCCSNPCTFTSNIQSANAGAATYRSLHTTAFACSEIILLYANYIPIQGTSMNLGWNRIYVGASLQLPGPGGLTDATGFQEDVSFHSGRRITSVDPGCVADSKPGFVPMPAGQNFFVNTYVSAPPVAAPSAPTLTPAGTGGTLVATANYYVSITYIYPDGSESQLSTATLATIPAGASTGTITVTAPAAVAGTLGYKVYMSARNATITANTLFNTPVRSGGTFPFSYNAIVTNEVSVNSIVIRRQNLTYRPAAGYLFGGANFAGRSTGEGFFDNTDLTQGSDIAAVTQQTISNGYWPVAILGKAT